MTTLVRGGLPTLAVLILVTGAAPAQDPPSVKQGLEEVSDAVHQCQRPTLFALDHRLFD